MTDSRRGGAEHGAVPELSLPDFLDFAPDEPDALFGAAASTAIADGGVLVFPDAVLMVSGDRSERIALDRIRGWRVDLDEQVFAVTIRADRETSSRLPIVFLAPTASALEALLGPPDDDENAD
ncbi:MAG: hypothetical protein ABW204_03510 [Microbacteriaceae bacterium]